MAEGRPPSQIQPLLRDANVRYVHVLKGVRPYTDSLDIIPSVLKHTGDVLISLQSMYGNGEFNQTKVRVFHDKLQALKNRYANQNVRIWIDSGGYSFIKGDINPKYVDQISEMYNLFLVESRNTYHRIFSLDLPFNKKYEAFNDVDNVQNVNLKLTRHSMDAIKASPNLREKFIFVSHARSKEIFQAWCDIYEKNNVGAYIQNRAIGGLVGVRAGTRNVMSPFLAATFKELTDYLNAPSTESPGRFSLHFLGINSIADRFLVAVLEGLFKSYDFLRPFDVDFSYDNSRFSEEARKGHRKNDAYILGQRLGLYYVPGYSNIANSSLASVFDEGTLKHAQDNFERWNQGQSVDGVAIFEPLNVHSQTEIDNILMAATRKHDLVDAFYHVHSERSFAKYVDAYLSAISHGHVLCPERNADKNAFLESTLFDNDNFKKTTKKNLLYAYKMHRCFVSEDPPYSGVDKVVLEFIDDWAADATSNRSGLHKPEA